MSSLLASGNYIIRGHSPSGIREIKLCFAGENTHGASKLKFEIDLDNRKFSYKISVDNPVAELTCSGKFTKDTTQGKILFIAEKKSWSSDGRLRPFVGIIEGFDGLGQRLVLKGN